MRDGATSSVLRTGLAAVDAVRWDLPRLWSSRTRPRAMRSRRPRRNEGHISIRNSPLEELGAIGTCWRNGARERDLCRIVYRDDSLSSAPHEIRSQRGSHDARAAIKQPLCQLQVRQRTGLATRDDSCATNGQFRESGRPLQEWFEPAGSPAPAQLVQNRGRWLQTRRPVGRKRPTGCHSVVSG